MIKKLSISRCTVGLIVQVLFGIDTFTVQLNTKYTEIRYIMYNHDKKMINFYDVHLVL